MKQQSYRISRVFIIYLISNLLLIIIPMMAAVAHNWQLQNLMDSSTDVANNMIAQQLQLVADHELKEIESMYDSCADRADDEGSWFYSRYLDEPFHCS